MWLVRLANVLRAPHRAVKLVATGRSSSNGPARICRAANSQYDVGPLISFNKIGLKEECHNAYQLISRADSKGRSVSECSRNTEKCRNSLL